MPPSHFLTIAGRPAGPRRRFGPHTLAGFNDATTENNACVGDEEHAQSEKAAGISRCSHTRAAGHPAAADSCSGCARQPARACSVGPVRDSGAPESQSLVPFCARAFVCLFKDSRDRPHLRPFMMQTLSCTYSPIQNADVCCFGACQTPREKTSDFNTSGVQICNDRASRDQLPGPYHKRCCRASANSDRVR